MYRRVLVFLFCTVFSLHANPPSSTLQQSKKIVYLVTDIRIPFWEIMARGISERAFSLGYQLEVLSSDNNPKKELELTLKAIREKADAIIVSPSTSSACVTILKFAHKEGIPVVISDVGTEEGEYLSYISSQNKEGAYAIGKVLTEAMIAKGYEKATVGIVAIPQKRRNAQERTAGFMQALREAGIKGADIKQQITWSEEETYGYVSEMIQKYPDLRAIWLQTSNSYKGALRAIKDAAKTYEILLVTFDAEPEFLTLIPQGVLVGSAMQQPYLMGEEALDAVHRHFQNEEVAKHIALPILPVRAETIKQMLPKIKRDVLGLGEERR